MISPERKELNKFVRELDELHFAFYTKLESAIVAILKSQPHSKISFNEHRPQIVVDMSNGNITLGTISSIWLDNDDGTIIAQMSWKDENVSFDETVSLWYSNLCDLYPTYTTLTEAIKKTLKDNENNQ